uniref:PH domain-containing protein n=1 Tax=Romanomermis culicivorax TaxID=13658 RepID=A0A915L9E9_ROMCU
MQETLDEQKEKMWFESLKGLPELYRLDISSGSQILWCVLISTAPKMVRDDEDVTFVATV